MSWDPVFRFVQRIPRGRVLTYVELAKALRRPGGARSAGRAMAATPTGKGIPWHRVVGERGRILIREPYASLQKKLLESEGVKITSPTSEMRPGIFTFIQSGGISARTPASFLVNDGKPECRDGRAIPRLP